MPQLNPAVSFAQFIKEQAADSTAIKAMAHCVDADKKYISQISQAHGRYMILIGPEGDFSEKEIEMALAAGFQPISLGEARLRTETAALAAVLEVSLLNR